MLGLAAHGLAQDAWESIPNDPCSVHIPDHDAIYPLTALHGTAEPRRFQEDHGFPAARHQAAPLSALELPARLRPRLIAKEERALLERKSQ